MTTVYCSGPAGPGVASSLRLAFPDLRIVGVDNDPNATGLHLPVFDEVSRHDGDVSERLESDGWWIPGSACEVRRLSRLAGRNDRVLCPATTALERFGATPVELARRLGLRAPPVIAAHEDDWRLAAFGREHGWRLTLRGPNLDATRIAGWRAVQALRAQLGARWAGMRLQADVKGAAEPVVFAAHRGVELGARLVRAAFPATAGGHVAALPDSLRDALSAELAAGAWTGGGVLELVRSVDGALWLVAGRPHFADWVHGATLAGENLPAALLAAASGLEPAPAVSTGSGFVRVAVDIPLRERLTVPEPATPSAIVRAGNYLSGMPDPWQRPAAQHPRAAPTAPDAPLRAVVANLPEAPHTPHAHAVEPAPRWDRLAAAVYEAAAGRCVQIAYSIKTDPSTALLRAARSHGFLAEAITGAEAQRAQDAGYAFDELVLNGPAKGWPRLPTGAFAAFADSAEELTVLAAQVTSGAFAARYLGPRLRPPSVASRFGVQLDDFAIFARIVETLGNLPQSQAIGVHFHWASAEAGHETWFETVATILDWSRRLQEMTGRPIACVDLGGGWQPDDFESVLLPRLADLVTLCHAELEALAVLVLEPGRALVQPLAIVETTVLELRASHGTREIVVDASLAELPRSMWYPHRLLSRQAGEWRQWGRGPDRVVGRLCMEDDVLRAGIAVPDDVDAGARVFIADAGAYDRSMAYSFGRG